MTWDIFSIIGTAAFAISGALVAMDEKYDVFGVYILGFVTAFGGGAIRNLLIGLPVSYLWSQTTLFYISLISITIILIFPKLMSYSWKKAGLYADAIGLAAFAIQGALHASSLDHSLLAIMVAAFLTGSGGGILRDVLAGRKPYVFKAEIYGTWAALAGLVIGLGASDHPFLLYALFAAIIFLRIFSFHRKWQLPVPKMHYQ
ncbi:trimeric intracellular cation channel family protein [Terribacillus saccharophilus]|uniref:Membrane protein n=1 Tax=Terribacillus saccharophilus TaxID=361277 RepID=A0A075LJK0_9BACI|nr:MULTISPECIES: trimeric intracellular cation channel family protein [Terribacillus]AIF66925.1 membrane protein [Terribacillus goriensis]MCM3224355.1 trimeric intracellular cation channel family protein [Terribacillus saccharophilus]MEC0283750.1 trimeric intracellular cation channel family protein [Terribacillus saccharophilus]MEC0290706.1 trimeric intracellular cation channel family protein [Terribacillus saccharophilus]MEC0303426.1 trimeric intracellular cation channel family protein [Terri